LNAWRGDCFPALFAPGEYSLLRLFRRQSHEKEVVIVRDYELTFIIQPELDEEDRTTVIGQVQDLITSLDGVVVKVDHWGQRKMAYAINNFRRGYYLLMNIQLAGENVRELERRLKISEPILRYLTVKLEQNG
jgi:small subunit ribosomal protein S6